ncbi:response regulator [Thermoproteota archaeon]
MSKPIILIIDTDVDRGQHLKSLLIDDYDVILSRDSQEGLSLFQLTSHTIKLILLALDCTDCSGISILNEAQKYAAFTEIIAYTKNEDLDSAVDSIKAGAFHYFFGLIEKKSLLLLLNQALQKVDIFERIKQISEKNFIKNYNYEKGVTLVKELINKRRSLGKTISSKEVKSLLPLQGQEDYFKNEKEITHILDSLNAEPVLEKQNPVILIVEDDISVSRNIDIILKKQFHTVVAYSGEEALEKAFKLPEIDIILLDIMLPDIKGYDLMPKLQEIHNEAEIIIITAFKITNIAVQVLHSGACTYLNKPFSKTKLLETISRAIQFKYLKNILKELDKKPESPLPYMTRMEMFKEFYQNRQTQNKGIAVGELYVFFPEFKREAALDNEQIPMDLDAQEDVYFWLESRFKKDILQQ